MTEQDRVCIPVPLYHCFGMVLGNLACMTHGATMVFPARRSIRWRVLQTVQAERCTTLYGVPTMFIADARSSALRRARSLELAHRHHGRRALPDRGHARVVTRMHMHEVTIAYGMTETSPISFQSSLDDTLERRVTTVGRVQPHLEVKIVDAGGRIVPRGQTGELLTRGYSVMLGYWGDDVHTGSPSTPRAGCTPAISRPSTMRAIAASSAGSKTWSSVAARTSTRVKSRSSSIAHPKVRDVQCVGVPDPEVRRGAVRMYRPARRRAGDRAGHSRFLRRQDRALQDSALCPLRRPAFR